jgi:Predicted transcriptional regulator
MVDIKKLRQKHRLTQEGLANRLGVTWTTVSRWERGKVKPHRLGIKALERLKDELETSKKGGLELG